MFNILDIIMSFFYINLKKHIKKQNYNTNVYISFKYNKIYNINKYIENKKIYDDKLIYLSVCTFLKKK